MPYAPPGAGGRGSASASAEPPDPVSPAGRVTIHSVSKPMSGESPAASARVVTRRRKDRWQAAVGAPDCSYLSPGAQAQPGWPARTVSPLRSGTTRRSPSGPPMYVLLVKESSTRATSKTGERPTPSCPARARRAAGTALTRVIPAVSTVVIATPATSGGSAGTCPVPCAAGKAWVGAPGAGGAAGAIRGLGGLGVHDEASPPVTGRCRRTGTTAVTGRYPSTTLCENFRGKV
ncbi:hypothetical protein GA0115246_106686 [Streptomyces sp. SolWspMP-sol7th]|nr:hypothetical protein GA0115246_106686 [Streptomyces sp. SolWspMP-sol7th]